MPGLYRIDDRPLDLQDAIRAVAGPDRGAIATFVGTTRNHHDGRSVRFLEYDAYPEMAEIVLRDIGREVEARFGTPHVAILHRVGRLEVGEASVVVAVAAAHRREALAACAHAIERVKASAPIWKKEHYADGAAWIEGPDSAPVDT
ncbi:MAG TPA: molybdenum cofactor biosynthesis protein MoaE [Candidatus Dormibacteraeota bacterium]|nr:molybdenum cofactor biosynthesis protein MoaE [Candidatus Dormibacteraeota bacterium]